MAENIVTQPRIAARNPNKQIKFIVGGLIILAAIIYLAFTSIQSTGAYYMTADQLVQNRAELVGRKLRVSGTVVHDTESWDAQNLMLKFQVTDSTGEKVWVSFHGSRPSNFGEATEAIIEGQLLPDGVFKADNLLLKCPSRYEDAPGVETEVKAID